LHSPITHTYIAEQASTTPINNCHDLPPKHTHTHTHTQQQQQQQKQQTVDENIKCQMYSALSKQRGFSLWSKGDKLRSAL
jgi:hypothetical protein